MIPIEVYKADTDIIEFHEAVVWNTENFMIFIFHLKKFSGSIVSVYVSDYTLCLLEDKNIQPTKEAFFFSSLKRNNTTTN